MTKSNMTIDHRNSTITVSKAFYNKASKYGTDEYRLLHRAMKDNPTFEIVIQESQKKSYNGLTFKRMEAYIMTQSNSEANLKEYSAVKKVAEAKGAKYPLTKKWFLQTFPEYKANEVSESEIGTSQDKSEHITNINEDVAA